MIKKLSGILESERLILRPFAMSDTEAMYRNWESDPEVTRFLTWPTATSIEDTKQILTLWTEEAKVEGIYRWAIVLKEINEPIGSIDCVRYDWDLEEVEIGYCIGKSFWGKGIVAEAFSTIIPYFFDEIQVRRITAKHDTNNPNSGRVMKKCGLLKEGVLRQAGKNNQGICDLAVYAMTRDDYELMKADPDNYIWAILRRKALEVQNGRDVSDYINAGPVSAAILTADDNIYTGVCVDTCSTLGICAERNAIFNMLTNGEQEIKKVIAFLPDGKSGAPCGACRELMVQLMPKTYRNIEIMMDYEAKTVVTMAELTPMWWIQ